MKTAMIVMTILGCDDGMSQCHYISTVNGAWQTVAICDQQSEKQLSGFSNSNYPVIVAVCETARSDASITEMPETAVTAETPAAVQPLPAPETEGDNRPTLPARAKAFLSGVYSDAEKLKTLVTRPVRYLGDGYSWVARKLSN